MTQIAAEGRSGRAAAGIREVALAGGARELTLLLGSALVLEADLDLDPVLDDLAVLDDSRSTARPRPS